MYLVGDQQERYIIEEISLKPWQVPRIWAWNHIYIMVLVPGTVVLGRNSDQSWK